MFQFQALSRTRVFKLVVPVKASTERNTIDGTEGHKKRHPYVVGNSRINKQVLQSVRLQIRHYLRVRRGRTVEDIRHSSFKLWWSV